MSRVFFDLAPRRSRFDYLALSRVTYAVRTAVMEHLVGRNDLVLIDVGAGEKPYYRYFRPHVRQHLGLDYRRKVKTDVQGAAERLPFADGCADVVLATQLLEHVADPFLAVREWKRVLRPGGLIFASTHGTFIYHPDPRDYWRWTHAGLRKLFEDAGLYVRSMHESGGPVAAAASIVAINTSLAAHRVGLGNLMRIALPVLHRGVDAVDPIDRLHVPSEADYGRTAINYVVVAERV